jgi:hypothetical protein
MSVEPDAAGGVSSIGKEPEHGACDGRFARAGLSDKGKAFAAGQFEPDIRDHAMASIGYRQIVDLEQRERNVAVSARRPREG